MAELLWLLLLGPVILAAAALPDNFDEDPAPCDPVMKAARPVKGAMDG